MEMVYKGYRVVPLLKRVASQVIADNVLGLAAGTAYYFFLSLFPLFLFVAPMLSLVGDKQQLMNFIIGQVARVAPGDAVVLVRTVLGQVIYAENAPGLISVGAVLALWAGSNIFSALMDALNSAYNVKETRPWWRRKLLAIAMVVVAGVILGTATVILLAGDDIAKWVSRLAGLGDIGMIWTAAQFPIAIAFLVGLAWVQFTFLPNVKQNKWHTLAGACTTVALWLLVTLGFRVYVQNFGNYNATYGTIGAVIVLLTWMYLSMLTVLIGGELASELHHGTGAIDPRRGAVIGDRIASGLAEPSTERVTRVEPMAASGKH
jgi:membrane protein